MQQKIAFIGFGEAGSTFAAAMAPGAAQLCAYDRLTDHDDTAAAVRARYQRCGVDERTSLQAAVGAVDAVLSMVTADQAPLVAEAAAPLLAPGSLYLDLNSVAPDTKRAAAKTVEAAGGRYVDVAVMAPVDPAALAVPLLVGGPHAEAGAEVLRAMGFTKVRVLSGPVGAASSIKMIRSVMVKGIEALTAECVLAADAAGVREEVLASLDASWPGADWFGRADYNLDRMMAHGLRRAAEMEEVVKTLSALGTGSMMTEGTVVRQRRIGELAIEPPEGLDAKLAALSGERKE